VKRPPLVDVFEWAGLAVIGARGRQIGCDWRMRGTSLSKYLKLGDHEGAPRRILCVYECQRDYFYMYKK
jgi:hypothetical protein